MLLESKVGIVTGAAQGLGKSIAELAAREGSRVVVSDVQADRGESVANAIRQAGAECMFVAADVTDAAQVESLVTKTLDAFGRVDWLCNNAVGGAGDFGPLDALSEASFQKTIDVCLKGVFLGTKAVLPTMLEQGTGSIINITTAGLHKAEAMLGAYIAAKGGVEALTRTTAAEYSARGIRANAVAPGGMLTIALERYFKKFPEFKQKTIDQHAMRRLGRTEEVAEPVIWLASDRASFVTGTTITCDGGTTVNSHLL